MTNLQHEINYSNEDDLISKALYCLENKLRYATDKLLNKSKDVCAYARLQLADEKEEIFAVLFLDNQHRLIAVIFWHSERGRCISQKSSDSSTETQRS